MEHSILLGFWRLDTPESAAFKFDGRIPVAPEGLRGNMDGGGFEKDAKERKKAQKSAKKGV